LPPRNHPPAAPLPLQVRYLVTIFCAFVFGTMYLGLGSQYNTQQDIQNIMGALYALNVFLGLMNAFTVLEPRAKERAVYYR
jgi:membrane-associated protease RseP (regulator of RpoE activity)